MASVYKSLNKHVEKKSSTTENNGVVRRNKQRVLVLPSRGVTYRQRHLMNDLAAMMPHSRKDVKFDNKSQVGQLNELAELYNCNNVLYFEARKGLDLYMWMGKVPNGPTVKFHAQNLYTMEELRFSGNCLKGSRPILSFDSAFDSLPHLRLIRELFFQVFGVPQGARKSKPFFDHVLGFTYADGKIWIRNYQINEVEMRKGDDPEEPLASAAAPKSSSSGKRPTDISLVEIGPRVVLTPIIIQEGSFGGPIIYENKAFVSPNQVRAEVRRERALRHGTRADHVLSLEAKRNSLGIATGAKPKVHDELETRKLFA